MAEFLDAAPADQIAPAVLQADERLHAVQPGSRAGQALGQVGGQFAVTGVPGGVQRVAVRHGASRHLRRGCVKPCEHHGELVPQGILVPGHRRPFVLEPAPLGQGGQAAGGCPVPSGPHLFAHRAEPVRRRGLGVVGRPRLGDQVSDVRSPMLRPRHLGGLPPVLFLRTDGTC